MVSAKEIRETLTKDKVTEGDEKVLNKYIFRPMSYPFSAWLVTAGISANQTSLLSFCFGLAALFLFVTNNTVLVITGVFCFFIWQILEFCDGNVARYTKTTSIEGHIIDNLNSDLIKFLLPISFSLHVYLYLDTVVILPKEIILFIGPAISFLLALKQYNRLIHRKELQKDKYYRDSFQDGFTGSVKKASANFISLFVHTGNAGFLIICLVAIFDFHEFYLIASLFASLVLILRAYIYLLKDLTKE